MPSVPKSYQVSIKHGGGPVTTVLPHNIYGHHVPGAGGKDMAGDQDAVAGSRSDGRAVVVAGRKSKQQRGRADGLEEQRHAGKLPQLQ